MPIGKESLHAIGFEQLALGGGVVARRKIGIIVFAMSCLKGMERATTV